MAIYQIRQPFSMPKQGFAAALMNSLPMGFYAPAQIIIGDGDNYVMSNKVETIDAIVINAF